jgi:hypothetical protein
MSRHIVSASSHINSPARLVYSIIADYRTGHPRILPRPPFESLVVEQGGTGAGTVVSVQMRLIGRVRTFRAEITEPEAGRILRETIPEDAVVTTFTVDPLDGGRRSNVTISTEFAAGNGLAGAFGAWLMRVLLRPVYVRELALLSTVALSQEIS